MLAMHCLPSFWHSHANHARPAELLPLCIPQTILAHHCAQDPNSMPAGFLHLLDHDHNMPGVSLVLQCMHQGTMRKAVMPCLADEVVLVVSQQVLLGLSHAAACQAATSHGVLLLIQPVKCGG